MTVTPLATADSITRRKLVLVKQLYQQAVVQSTAHHSIMARILAVIEFDLAIETVLRAVIESLNPKKAPAERFQDMIQQAEDVLRGKGHNLPERSHIIRVHSIRNDAQHKARHPNETDVSDCRTYTRDFLQALILTVWGLTFETISLADIIQHDRVKALCVKAELVLAQGQYLEAAGQALGGLQVALRKVETAFVGRAPRFDRIAGVDARWLEQMRESLLFASLGLKFADYVRVKQIVPVVLVGADQETVNIMRMESAPLPDQSQAEFVVAYCIDSIVQIENLVGDIDAPFGVEHWF